MNRLFALLFVTVFALPVFSQTGKVIESLKFESKLVGYPVEYSVYLPADYETSNRSYPVLYLLHGYSDDETGWIQFGYESLLIGAQGSIKCARGNGKLAGHGVTGNIRSSARVNGNGIGRF